MAQFDTLIRGGRIVDGSGAPSFVADIAIKDGKIAAVGKALGQATRTLDADGLTVAPGWVDIHTHYDGQVSWDADLAQSLSHGVTTAVMGNCGVGFAPVAPDNHDFLIGLMEGVEDIPGASLRGHEMELGDLPAISRCTRRGATHLRCSSLSRSRRVAGLRDGRARCCQRSRHR